jgi:hypothetical protein
LAGRRTPERARLIRTREIAAERKGSCAAPAAARAEMNAAIADTVILRTLHHCPYRTFLKNCPEILVPDVPHRGRRDIEANAGHDAA